LAGESPYLADVYSRAATNHDGRERRGLAARAMASEMEAPRVRFSEEPSFEVLCHPWVDKFRKVRATGSEDKGQPLKAAGTSTSVAWFIPKRAHPSPTAS